jgi:rSAM/selenodomain-associated transferase 1
MAKAPRPGACKTRLTPMLTPEQAAELSGAFLRDVTANLCLAATHADIAPYVAYAPAGTQALFAPHVAPGTALVLADGVGDMPTRVTGFGRCLLHAIRGLFGAGHDSVCVLNADSPTLPTAILCRAAEWLARPGDHAVLGAAEDGGYYLLGVKRAHAALFADIDWSTAAVAAQTRERAASIGLELAELPPWYDVDDAASLRRLLDELHSDGPGFAAPATKSCVARLGLAQQISRAA